MATITVKATSLADLKKFATSISKKKAARKSKKTKKAKKTKKTKKTKKDGQPEEEQKKS